jgi:hypothetical protein
MPFPVNAYVVAGKREAHGEMVAQVIKGREFLPASAFLGVLFSAWPLLVHAVSSAEASRRDDGSYILVAFAVRESNSCIFGFLFVLEARA